MVETMQGSVAGTLTGPGPGLLVAEQVHKLYRTGQTEVHALAGLDLAVGHGELVAVMGPSGSGKTTLLNCLSGLDEIDGGRVLVEGHDLFAMTDAQRTEHRARSMGFIFQSFNLIPVFNAAEKSDAAIPGIPVTSTLKRVQATEKGGQLIKETVSRNELWMAQTPQVFRRDLLLDAYSKRGDAEATDEASLVEKLGHPVTVVPGSPMNLKITTYDDFKMAEALVDALPKDDLFRPLHPFADDNPHLFS